VLGWDQCQARAWDAACRHTALSALAQLRQAAIRNALCGLIRLPPAGDAGAPRTRGSDADADVDDADLRIPLGDAPIPAYPGQPRPRRTGLIRLSVAETARLARLAADWAAGLLTPARLAQAAPSRRPVVPPRGPPGRGGNLTPGGRKEVTACNRDRRPVRRGT